MVKSGLLQRDVADTPPRARDAPDAAKNPYFATVRGSHVRIEKFLQCKFAPGTEGRFRGWASTWGIDRQGDQIRQGAFRKTLEAWNARGARIPLLWMHHAPDLIGATLSAEETAEGLDIEGQLIAGNALAENALRGLEVGGVSLSIGYDIPPGGAILRGDGVREVREIDLYEISLVSVPANAGAVIRDVKSDIRTFEAAARDVLGLSRGEAKRLASGGFAAMVRDAPAIEPNPKAQAFMAALQRIINA